MSMHGVLVSEVNTIGPLSEGCYAFRMHNCTAWKHRTPLVSTRTRGGRAWVRTFCVCVRSTGHGVEGVAFRVHVPSDTHKPYSLPRCTYTHIMHAVVGSGAAGESTHV